MTQDALYNLNLMIATTLLVVAFICTILFYQEWKKQKRTENEQYIPYALMILYLLLFIGIAMIIHSNFFTEATILTFLMETKVYFIGVVIISSIVIGILIYIAERIARKNTKHFFLIYFIFFSALLIFFSIKGIAIFRGIFFLGSIPFWFLIGSFIYRLIWKTSGEIRKKMVLVVIGFGLFIMIFTQAIILILRNEFEILLRMKAVLLIAATLTGYGFYTIPSFTEFDWPEKIRHLYIVNPKGGVCLFHQAFKAEFIDQDLFGGSLIAIQSLMQEMIQSDKMLKVIDHEDAKILFEKSPHAFAIMVADEDLYVIHQKLEQLLKEFEHLFSLTMEHWTGNLELFQPLQPIINRIFEIKE
ncbi:MAG: hypothetical protein ACFFD2_26315 [Promethearchaeota archaeon]